MVHITGSTLLAFRREKTSIIYELRDRAAPEPGHYQPLAIRRERSLTLAMKSRREDRHMTPAEKAARRRERALKIWETRRRLYGPSGLPTETQEASRENRREGALIGWSIRKRREARERQEARTRMLSGKPSGNFPEGVIVLADWRRA